MDDEDSQLLVDDSNFQDIFVKCEPPSPISDVDSIGNVEKLIQPPPEKILKIEDTLDKNVSSNEPSNTVRDEQHVVLSKRKKRKHVELDPFEREILKILEANRSQLDFSIRDPDTMFFISHVPVIKQFNPKVKLDFQVKFMQLLQSYSLPSVRVVMENQPLNEASKLSNIEDSSSNDCV